MAIDDAEKRKSISGIPIFIAGVTSNASKDHEWRKQVMPSYSGIAFTYLNSSQDRKSVSGIPLPFLVGVTPTTRPASYYRASIAWNYYGIAPSSGETTRIPNHGFVIFNSPSVV